MLNLLNHSFRIIMILVVIGALITGFSRFSKLKSSSNLENESLDDSYKTLKEDQPDILDNIPVGSSSAQGPVTMGDQADLFALIMVYMKKHKIFRFIVFFILASLAFIFFFTLSYNPN